MDDQLEGPATRKPNGREAADVTRGEPIDTEKLSEGCGRVGLSVRRGLLSTPDPLMPAIVSKEGVRQFPDVGAHGGARHGARKQAGGTRAIGAPDRPRTRGVDAHGPRPGNRAIASQLDLSVKTIETYHARIKEKLGLQTAHELIRAAVRWAEL